MNGICSGDLVAVAGVANEDSIAYHTAQELLREGAEVVYFVHQRVVDTARAALAKLYGGNPAAVSLIVVDLNDDEQLAMLADRTLELTGGRYFDAILHSVAFAGKTAIRQLFDVPRKEIHLTLDTSAVSFVSLVGALLPITNNGARIVALSFAADRANDGYVWIAVAKAALEEISRHMARELGPRGIKVNIVSPGVIYSKAASGIPSLGTMIAAYEDPWLKWDVTDVAVVIVNHLSRRTCETAMVVYVDGGVHARIASPHDQDVAEGRRRALKSAV